MSDSWDWFLFSYNQKSSVYFQSQTSSVNIPLHVSGVQRTDAVSQRFVRVGRDLLKLVGLHLLKETGQVLLPGLQLSPLVGPEVAKGVKSKG